MSKTELDAQAENLLSITQVVELQDSLKKDTDFNKPEEELTPSQRANKAIYLALDQSLKEVMGNDQKDDLDRLRDELSAAAKLKKDFTELLYLGKEIEKSFVFQEAYLVNHFDRSSENIYKGQINAATDHVVDASSGMTDEQRVDEANSVLSFIDSYEGKVVTEITGKQEVLSALLPRFEKKFTDTDFELFEKEVEDGVFGEKSQAKFEYWLGLSKELLEVRAKAIEAVQLDLEMDRIVPKHVVNSRGDLSQNVSSSQLLLIGERMLKLASDADKEERSIAANKPRVAEELFGELESYLDIPSNGSSSNTLTEGSHTPDVVKSSMTGKWLVVIVLTIIALSGGIWTAIGVFLLGSIVINIVKS